MKINEAINRADVLIRKAAEFHSSGDSGGAIELLVELKELLDEPITLEPNKGTDTEPTHCSKCNQVID